jgi:uncharacterized repeat protein (TIGR01451 family)/CSLREA domain-containing protein
MKTKRTNLFYLLSVCAIVFAVAQALAILPTKASFQTSLADKSPATPTPATKPAAPASTFVVNTADDHDDGTCTAGDCSFREAINAANANAGADTITFAIGSGAQTINLTSALPSISANATVNATTQPGFSGTPIIELNGAAIPAASVATGLSISSNCTIRGFVINRFVGSGISVSGGSNTISGNYIGTNIAGNARLGNGDSGIFISGGNSNIIGGATAATRNVISGNDGSGIVLFGPASGSNQILGNFIGVDATGAFEIGNKSDGVSISRSSNNLIGSTTTGTGNIISGNANGIHIIDVASTNNVIAGNLIGTNVSGTAAISNQFSGIDIFNGINNTIGGTTAAARNVISGNGVGLNLNNSASGNIIQGNFIGTKSDGVSSLSNLSNGIVMNFSASNNFVGGVNTGEGNTIAFNKNNGISIGSSCTGNAIEGNSIFSNDDLGIDLVPTGVTANDAGDADTGANGLQNFPILTSASTNSGGGVNIQGSLNSTANATFRIEFFYNASCDASGNGEGKTFIGFANVTTSSLNNVSFNLNFSTAVPGGSAITATATATASPTNTSEFSPCVVSTALADLAVTQTASPNPVTVGSNLTFTITATNNGPDTVTNAVVADSLPLSVSVVSCSSTNGGVCGGLGNNRIVTFPTLASGVSATITFITKVDCAVANNATISNTATISSSVTDPVANNSATTSTTVSHPATQISPTSQAFPATGGGASIGVTIPTGCAWTASSNAAWISIASGASGTGNGTVSYLVAVNGTGSQRSGTLTVAGLTFTVTQSGDVCSYALSPTQASVGQAATTGSVNVTTATGCGWKAVSNDSWIEVTSGSPGVGNGTFTYAVEVNATGAARTGSISVQNQTFTITQATSPTAVKLISFSAKAFDSGVLIEWNTGQEADNLGFNIYREEDGRRTRVTPEIVAGSALLAGSGTVLTAGKTYAWWDALPKGKQNAHYWLEDIDLNGTRTLHGPVTPQFFGGQPSEKVNADLLSKLGRVEPRIFTPTTAEQQFRRGAMTTSQQLAAWELAAKAAVKITVREAGWYRLTQAELLAAGLDAKINPQFLQLYAEGKEQAILVTGEEDSSFDGNDAVEFYGNGLDTPATDKRVYWLVAGNQFGKRINLVKSAAKRGGAQSFAATLERKDRSIYFSSLRNGDKENFFGAVIARDPVEQILALQNLNAASQEQAAVEIALQGVTKLPHFVEVSLNGNYLGVINFAEQAQGASKFVIPQTLLREGANQVVLTAQGGPSDVSLVDYIRITYQQKYLATQDALRCTIDANNPRTQTIDGFSNAQIRVVDITDTDAAQELLGNVEQERQGYSISVQMNAPSQRTLLAFTEDNVKHPVAIVANQASNWHDAGHVADFVILSHKAFIDSLAPLKALRQQQGFAVEIVDVEDLYDEFSFGEKEPAAIKDFLASIKNSWKKAPRFVLFVGDASFDLRNYLGLGSFDFVPSKLLETALMESVSDDWFADFNNDGLAEMFVGRLPVRTSAEAAVVVAKIVGYDSANTKSPVLKRSVLLVADKTDGFDFEEASHQLRALIPVGTTVQEIFRSRMDDATAKQKLIEGFNSGQSIVNYAGHGSVNLWRALLTNDDVSALQNQQNLPLVVTMTCLNGYFQDPVLPSLAEELLKAERGGAIAVWASSALTEPSQQATLNQQMYRLLFDAAGGKTTLGEVTGRAKATVNDADIRRTWILFGDPTMRLK